MGAVADPDLQIREGVGHRDSEIREEPGLKVKGGGADPGGLFPGSTTDWCPS